MLLFGRLRQRIPLKCVPHVQHDYFSSFNQSDHCFLSLSMSLPSSLLNWGAYAKATATAAKTSLENKHLGNGDYFQIIASSSHPILMIEHAANG